MATTRTITATQNLIDQTNVEGLTEQALGMWRTIVMAAQAVGLDRINLQSGAGGGHKSHAHGTELDVIGYNVDGSLWTFEQRMMVAMVAAGVGANRFGFYTQGGGPTTLHVGLGYEGVPRNVAWGPGGRTSGVGVNAFAPQERAFIEALRGGQVGAYLQSPEVMSYAANPPTMLPEGAIAAVNRVAGAAPTLAGTIGAGISLERGGSGAAVSELQTFLVGEGYGDADGNELAIDGRFGPRTEQALREYQSAQGLTQSGIADVDTFNRIQADLAGVPAEEMPRFAQQPDVRAAPPSVDLLGQRTLRRGVEGDDVGQLQRMLNFLGFTGRDGSALAVDGVYGRNTAYAVSQFQQARGLTVDGVAGTIETLPAVLSIHQAENLGISATPQRQAPALADLDQARLGGGGEPSLDRVPPTYPTPSDETRGELALTTDVPQTGYQTGMAVNPYLGMSRQELEAIDARDLNERQLQQVRLAYQDIYQRKGGPGIDLEQQQQEANRSATFETRDVGGGLIRRGGAQVTSPGGRWDLTLGNPDVTAPTHELVEPPPLRIADLWRFYPNYSYNPNRRPPRLAIAQDVVVNADPELQQRAAMLHWLLAPEPGAEPRYLTAPSYGGEPMRRVETVRIGPDGQMLDPPPPPPPAATPGGRTTIQDYQDAIDRANQLLEEYGPRASLSVKVNRAQPRSDETVVDWFAQIVTEATGMRRDELPDLTTMFNALNARGSRAPKPMAEQRPAKNRTPNLSRAAANGPKVPPLMAIPDPIQPTRRQTA